MNCFKEKRLEYRISIEDVSRKIFISTYVIEDLENENYNSIPRPFFYYCAKNYADFLMIELPEIIKKTKPVNAK